jgi:hypothetical protein
MVCVRLIGPQTIESNMRNMLCYQNYRWEKFGKLTKNALPAIGENWKEVYIEAVSRILKYFVPCTLIHYIFIIHPTNAHKTYTVL